MKKRLPGQTGNGQRRRSGRNFFETQSDIPPHQKNFFTSLTGTGLYTFRRNRTGRKLFDISIILEYIYTSDGNKRQKEQ